MIVSYDEAATFLGPSVSADDADLIDFVDAADAWVKNYCQRQFDYAQRVEYIRTYGRFASALEGPGEGYNWVYLREDPVDQIVEVKYDPLGIFGPEIMPLSSQYLYVTEKNRLVYIAGLFGPALRSLKVTYKAGYYMADDESAPSGASRMPADLRVAVKRIVSVNRKLQASSGGEMMVEERFEKYQYRRDIRDSTEPYDRRIMDTLENYARTGW